MPNSRRRGSTGLIRRPVTLETDVYTLALERVERCYQLFDTVMVGFSGGKDSTALLNVTLQVAERLDRLPLHVVFHDEEAIPVQTEEYMRRLIAAHGEKINLEWHTLPFRCNNACSATDRYWYPWAPEDEHLWVRPRPPEGLTTLPGFPLDREKRRPHYESNPYFTPLSYGRAIYLMGVRAEESMNRANGILRGTKDAREAYITYFGKYREDARAQNVKGYPIYDWKVTDVWHAVDHFGWDYNEAYDIMRLAGITPRNQRCGPAFGNQCIQKLWTYSTCFPEIWPAMTGRVPGVTAAMRYAQTDIYGSGSIPPKPDGLTWPEYARQHVLSHNPALQAHAADRVQAWIRNHYNKVSTPILPHARHPETGVCWEWLVKIAMTGDPMEREQAGNWVIPANRAEEYAQRLSEYEAELATYEGRLEELGA